MSRPHIDRERGRAAVRLRYASELWRDYLEQSPLPPLDRWLSTALRRYRQFGSRDRRAYRDILFATARFAYLAAFIISLRQQLRQNTRLQSADLLSAVAAFSRQDPTGQAALEMIRQVPAEALFRIVGQRYQLGSVDRWPLAGLMPESGDEQFQELLDLLNQSRDGHQDIRIELLWQGIPLWLADSLLQRANRSQWTVPQLLKFLAEQSSQPPLWLRLNHLAHQQDVLSELAEHGLRAVAQGQAIRVSEARDMQSLRLMREGLVEVQDWASQEIGHAVGAQPGESVWDACAGAGGKTVQLASALADQGILYATDIRPRELDEARRRVERAGFDMLRTLVWRGDGLPAFGPEIQSEGGFDRVLVDAPCSSSGVWRRHPDGRFRLSAQELVAYQGLQLRLLKNAAAAVRPGGRLVYGTCSWLVEENEELVERFLIEQPDFELKRMTLHGNPAVDADTMFSAVMQRLAN